MKKLLAIVAMALPISVTFGANLTVTWDQYPYPLATAHAECRKGTANFVEVGTAPATSAINVAIPAVPGDKIDCVVFTTWGDQTSPRSEVAGTTVPFPSLPAPVGVRVAP